ncbi:MAG TPA: carboxypeptidase-like regulatory domain-containing protein [Terriglobales bacterium]|nr:carboxypeptidase-like regulatory domain-containing protein [Terriglobales bacterium]
MRGLKHVVAVVSVAISLAAVALAQGGATGAISGNVQDPSGAYVAGAEVRIINQDTGVVTRSVKTDANGAFNATLLPVGTYTVEINTPGFQATKVADVAVRVTETTRMTARVRPMKVLEQVEVQAQVQSVDTTTATTGESVEARTIRNLPLSTQNFQQLLTLSAGTNSDLNASASLGRGDVRIQVNGQREDNNNYLIEGISATDYNVAELTNTPLPSPDVVQEFKVQTSLYDATQGRNGGGNINAILKSGTRNFHGSLFEFFRNTDLNANEYFLKRNQAQLGLSNRRPDIKQNIFGGSLGGPIGNEGKLGFFFFNYQGTRQRSGLSNGAIISTTLPSLPTDRSAQNLVDTFFSGDPNVTAASIDPVALKLLNFKSSQFNDPHGFLFPTADPTTGVFTLSKPGRYTDDQFTANYDRDFRGGSDKISARFFFSNFESVLPFGAGGLTATLGGTISQTDLNFPLDLPVHDRFLSIAETHLFSPRLVNEIRFGYVRIDNNAINQPIVTVNDLGINRPNSNLYDTIYKFTFSTFQLGPTPGANQSQLQNNFTFLDTASYSLGKHQLRFGGEFDRVNLDKNFPQTFNGQLFFFPTGGNPGNPADPCVPIGGCSDFQNFLLGQPGFSFGGSGVSNHQYRINDYALFLQDDYKATPNLTINAGLRWELFGAAKDNLCHIGNTISALANKGISPFVYPKCVSKLGVPGFTGTLNDTTMANRYASNFGPRIGFAYDLFGHHDTSIRGGYGIFYVREDVGTVDQLSFTAPILPITTPLGTPGDMADVFASGVGRLPKGGVIDPAYIPVYSQFLGFADCTTGAPTTDTSQCATFDNGFPNAFGNAAHPNGIFGGNSINLFGLEVPRHFVSPSTQQWNLSVQRQLPGNWILEVGYVGTKGTHLRETRDAIQPVDARIHPVTVKAMDGTTYTITTNSFSNANARSRALGLATQNYQLFASDAWSNYNSLQTTVSHRFSRSLYFQGAYTFSKALDATSSGNTAFNTAINDQTNLRDSYGLGDFDRTHRLVLSYNWDLPFFHDKSGLVGGLLSRWSLSGITTFQSGTPFTIIDAAGGTAFNLSSPNTSTATLNPGFTIASAETHGSVHDRLNQWFDPNAFSGAPVVGVDGTTGFGNLGRNTFRGPFQQNWDVSIGKNFHISESKTFKFSADFFNIWNHPIFASPNNIFNGLGFGTITSTKGTPRLIQLSARFAF